MAKTVVIWDSLDANLEFFVTDKDVARFDKKYVNANGVSGKDSKAISMLMYNEAGERVIQTVKDFPVQDVRDGASVIVTGFLP